MAITRITRAYTRRYSDNGQVTAYVEWLDERGAPGRTEGSPGNTHMAQLLARAWREGVTHLVERW